MWGVRWPARVAGVLCAGVLSDRLGRRRTMLVSAVLFTVSAAGCALCADFTQLVVCRIVGGLGIGVVSVVSPLYISEVSAARRRGMLVSFYQLAVTMGFLAAYTVNYLLLRMGQTAGFETAWMRRIFVDEVWRGMLGAETLPALVFFVIIFFIPESPRWLVLRGHTDRALRVLGRINGDRAEAAAELAAIETAVGGGQAPQWRLLLSKGIRTAVLVGAAIAILGQFMGVNAVLYYGPSIFERAGWSGSDSLFAQILVGAVNMLTTVLALAIIDRVGRKRLVYWGVSGMVLSLLLIGTCFLTGERLGDCRTAYCWRRSCAMFSAAPSPSAPWYGCFCRRCIRFVCAAWRCRSRGSRFGRGPIWSGSLRRGCSRI